MLFYLIVILGVVLGFFVVAFVYFTFVEKNLEEPSAIRKWTDPAHRE